MIIKGKFAHYKGEALKREEVSSIRVNPGEEKRQSKSSQIRYFGVYRICHHPKMGLNN